MSININKPKAIQIDEELLLYSNESDVESTIEYLLGGKPIIIKGFYSDGLFLLKEIHKYLKLKLPNKSYKEQQGYRAEYYKLSNLILLEVVHQKLLVKKAPSIGWLKKLYPENDHFCLSFPQIQGMNSSWQWYEKGVSMPVLRNKIHPYYGTYFPTRFEHLILFDNWLKRYSGAKKSAMDIGVGSGVLTLQLMKYNFQKVYATDVNPNAIIGMKEFIAETKLARKIELDCGHLFGQFQNKSELIVFNPPWLPEKQDAKLMDKAIYYDQNLFPDFFSEAKKRLLPEGSLVIIFSNLAQVTKLTSEHPIEKELSEFNRFKLDKCYIKSVKEASNKTKRDQYWRGLEEVELWVLKSK